MNNTPCLRRVPKLCVHLKFLRINVFDETWSRRATSISNTISFPFPSPLSFPLFFFSTLLFLFFPLASPQCVACARLRVSFCKHACAYALRECASECYRGRVSSYSSSARRWSQPEDARVPLCSSAFEGPWCIPSGYWVKALTLCKSRHESATRILAPNVSA